ncbi:peptidoglycan-binding protein [Alteribacter populi]|uniref:peptidoglycan-binding protein n=1 Tax=Alteribacter populi TaxID=2011011 RepID=UPI000BBAFAF3|nr:peptidoglycan-binding protein [Alteribacter populi]
MKNFAITKMKTLGLPIIAAGAFFFTSPLSSDASSEPFLGDKLLDEGKEHAHVEELQELLTDKGFLDEDAINGAFDTTTREAVKEFQTESNILIDGIAGVQTIGALAILREGDEGEVVEALQDSLNELGYYDANIDGEFGSVTHDAVKEFQSEKDILVDGLAGPQTYATLHAALNDSESNGSTTSEKSSNESSKNSNNQSTDRSSNDSSESSESETTMEMEATAYTAHCDGCSGITYTGQNLLENPDKKVVAVDPDVIPLGSKVEVEGYGTAIAGDIGGAIQGNRIDLHMATKDEAKSFGRQTVTVRVLED